MSNIYPNFVCKSKWRPQYFLHESKTTVNRNHTNDDSQHENSFMSSRVKPTFIIVHSFVWSNEFDNTLQTLSPLFSVLLFILKSRKIQPSQVEKKTNRLSVNLIDWRRIKSKMSQISDFSSETQSIMIEFSWL